MQVGKHSMAKRSRAGPPTNTEIYDAQGKEPRVEKSLMGTDGNKGFMRSFLEELDKNLSAVDEIFSPRCLAHLPGVAEPTDREGFKNFVASLYAAFPDLHHEVEEQIRRE